jgi:hypothetical protein
MFRCIYVNFSSTKLLQTRYISSQVLILADRHGERQSDFSRCSAGLQAHKEIPCPFITEAQSYFC